MGRDRFAALILKAAASGLVDFSAFDQHSATCWLKLKLLAEEIDKQNTVRLWEMQHHQQLSMMSHAEMTTESLDKSWESANGIVNDVADLLFPWHADNDDNGEQQTAYDRLRDSWINAWGDPSDPTVSAKIKATADWLRRTDQSKQAGMQ